MCLFWSCDKIMNKARVVVWYDSFVYINIVISTLNKYLFGTKDTNKSYITELFLKDYVRCYNDKI